MLPLAYFNLESFPSTVFIPSHYFTLDSISPVMYFSFRFQRTYLFRISPLQSICLLQSIFPADDFYYRFFLTNIYLVDCSISQIFFFSRLFSPRVFFHYKVFHSHRFFQFRVLLLTMIIPSDYLSQISGYFLQYAFHIIFRSV